MKNAGAAAAASLLVDLRDRRGINAAAFDTLLVRLVDDGRFNHARQLARRFGGAPRALWLPMSASRTSTLTTRSAGR